MSEFDRRSSGRQRRPRRSKVTSPKTIRIHQSLSNRLRANKQAREMKRATYLATLPKNPAKRLLFRMQPKRLAHYWFSRQGAVMALKVIGVGIVIVFLLTIGVFAYFRKDLPNIKDISGDNIGGSISYYDSTGKVLLWQDYNAVKRIPVASDQISTYMKEATVAIEDKNFYHEGAFNFGSIIRAGFFDLIHHGEGLQGASTITEQVVKLNENWTGNRTITTKLKELILAVELSREYSKNDILVGYLNAAPYGGVEYGCEAAAEDYFHSTCQNLTLPQAALLAAVPQAPSVYSPYSSPQYNPAVAVNYFDEPALIGRQQYILDQMAQQGYISQAQANQAKGVNILAEVQPLENKYSNIQAPYFVLAAKQQLDNEYGATTVNRGGWKVITTLNLGLQADAEKDVQANEASVAAVRGDEEAMVAEDVNTGQVVALVGGEDFNNPDYGQINYVNTNISPGSSMKPFLYAALIQNNNNVGAGSVLYDSQGPLPGYPCTDKTEPTATSNGGNCLWDDNFIYPGAETIRYALAGSRNVPAVKASYEIIPHDTSPDYTASINKWISLANEAIGTSGAYGCYPAGVNIETATADQQTQCYGSAAIGSGDIALDQEVNGDTTLARLGAEIPQTYILQITDSTGKTIYQWQQPKSTQVYNPDTAYIINSMLDDPRATYLQPYQKFQNYDGWDIAVKTGTENQEYNGVMTAWSTQYAVIGFAGYHTLDQPLVEGHFEDITEPITKTWMEQALTALHTKPVNWTQPTNVKVLPDFVQRVSTGYGAEVPGPSTDLFPSWYVAPSSSSSTETLDKVSGNIATSCTPTLAKETVGGANANAFSIDIFYPPGQTAGSTSSVSGTPDTIHNCNDSPPTVTVTQGNCEDISDCDFTVTVTQGTDSLSGGSYTTAPAGTIELIANGQTLATQTIPSGSVSPYTTTFSNVAIVNGETIEAQAVDSVLYSGTNTTPPVVDPNTNKPGTPSTTGP